MSSLLVLALVACGNPAADGAGAEGQPTADAADTAATVDSDAVDHDAMDHEAMDHDDAEAAFESAAVRFAEDVFDVDAGDYGVSFAPDGETLFFTRAHPIGNEAIYFARRGGAGWEGPRLAPFSGRYHDKEPFAAPDGRRVYFASKRPLSGTIARQDFELWYVEVGGPQEWGEPVHIGALSSPYNDDYPAVAADGTVVFARNDDTGNVDLWIAAGDGRDGLGEPQKIGFPINTGFVEADPWIAPDGGFILFSSPQSSPNAQGQGDLYVIHRQGEGWSRPVSLGLHVNAVSHEYGPAMSPDGATFYFSRGFGGSVWTVPTALLDGFE